MEAENFSIVEHDRSSLKVLITTSGVGSRLGDLTSYTNKSLVKVGDKLALSHIIEKYPPQTRFVVTLGYFGNQVEDFLKVAYPKHNFEFFKVLNYQGVGSSLGLSMLSAQQALQEPFIFHASDTLIFGEDEIKSPTHNWVGGAKGNSASQYASFDVSSDIIMNFYDKGMMDFDYLHIGLIGIYDYKLFWDTLNDLYTLNPDDGNLNDLVVLQKMKLKGTAFKVTPIVNWFDMGNTESLFLARNSVGEKFDILEKTDESISFCNDSVIKFFANEKVAQNRVERAHLLGPLVPKVTNNRGNFYRYNFVSGSLASFKTTAAVVQKLLNWSDKFLWRTRSDLSDQDFQDLCISFYREKTIQRVEMFLEKSNFTEGQQLINGVSVPSIFELLEKVDFKWLGQGVQTQFHGDFILDNIIQTQNGFTLIDWRQDFGGNISSGDMYYDLAKLNHSLVINHEIINLNHFSISITSEEIFCDVYRKHELIESSVVLNRYIEANNLDAKKVKVLTALIWLNMAPLHHHPFDLFLFNFGKLSLWRALQSE